MKVAILSFEYPPFGSGGISSFAYDLSRKLAELGVEVHVISGGRRGESLKRPGLRIHRLGSPTLPPGDAWFYTTKGREISKVLREESPGVIHDAGGAIRFLPWITKGEWRVVKTVHGSPSLERVRASSTLEDLARHIAFKVTHSVPGKLFSWLASPEIDASVYVSKFCLKDALSYVDDRGERKELRSGSVVINNGVDVDRIRARFQEDLGKGSREMAFLGRLMEYKGIRFLLKAFEKARKEVEDAKLHIVGDGPLYPEIEQLKEKKELDEVELHGHVPREDALRILARSRFLVHPSFHESCGMSILEAYALGKPAIAHEAPYAAELVEEKNSGITVDVRDLDEFSGQMIRLLENGDLIDNLAEKARETAKEYSVERTAKKYKRLYENLLS